VTADVRVEIAEQRLGGVPWLIVRGPRREAFVALGAHTAVDVKAVLDELPDLASLRGAELADRFAAVRDASREHHPAAWSDLEALAEGANVDFDDLLLLNLRGDLGVRAGAGCSDLAWTDGSAAFMAHNEDDYPVLGPRYRVLTLLLEDEPAVTAWWAPGFLPANTWAATGRGLVYTIDHLNIVSPDEGPGRHFVAREMQRARDVDEAIEWLRSHPSAGGFTYTLGRVGEARVVVVETGAGQCAPVEVAAGREPRWHTNHVRRLPPELDAPKGESLARGRVLARLATAVEPDQDWFLSVLGSPPPRGVHRNATDGDDLATHCTIVADLVAGDLTFAGPDGQTVTTSFAALTAPTQERMDIS
jgi:hypothetical protein